MIGNSVVDADADDVNDADERLMMEDDSTANPECRTWARSCKTRGRQLDEPTPVELPSKHWSNME